MEVTLLKSLEFIMSNGLTYLIPLVIGIALAWLTKYRFNPIHEATTSSIVNENMLQDTVDTISSKSKIGHEKILDKIDTSKKEILDSHKELMTKLDTIDRSQLKTELKTDEILRTSKANKGGL